MFKFYAYIDGMDWNRGITKFYPSIEEVILDDNDFGEIELYNTKPLHPKSCLVGINPDANTVPELVTTYSFSTIELYELAEYLKDEPEMNERNYMVFSRSDENYEDMLTIVCLT